jgi:hypothetical protein
MSLDLNDVTICAADSVNSKASARALRLSMEAGQFSDAILFTDAEVTGPFRTVKIGKLTSFSDYSNFIIKQLPSLTHTAYVLVVQWDGYVVNPAAWHPSFRAFDYIGARWTNFRDGNTVGNGGFSLRSRRLLDALLDDRFPSELDVAEDVLICRRSRTVLEENFGIRFAPEGAAMQFSYENEAPKGPTFGFHGMGNMWRYVPDAEMVELLDLLDPYSYRSPHCCYLLMNYYLQKKVSPLFALYEKIREHWAPEELLGQMTDIIGRESMAREAVQFCEGVRNRRTVGARMDVVRIAPMSALSRAPRCYCGSRLRYPHCHGMIP